MFYRFYLKQQKNAKKVQKVKRKSSLNLNLKSIP